MSIDVKVYDNGDHTALIWLPQSGQPISDCRGFAIKRQHNGSEDYLHSLVGFREHDECPKPDVWKWPLQRYMWWDYSVRPGDTVRYQVVPVVGASAAGLNLKTELSSEWTATMTVTGQSTDHLSAYFNRGIVAAQWVSRELNLEAEGQDARSAIGAIIKKEGDPLRDALGGQLKVEILKMLSDAKDGEIYAALYELNDPELKRGLEAMQGRAHVILANGAFNSQTPDENETARAELKAAGVDVFDRMVHSGHFAHNKFAVFCDGQRKAQKVLTGSTNWSVTGLCTQANNGLVIDNAEVANCFLEEWNRLKQAGDAFPNDLMAANSKIKQFTVDGVQVTPWFAPTWKQQDLAYARQLIANAKGGILFLFFNPGTYQEDPVKKTLLQNVLERHDPKNPAYDANLYIRGVVNQQIQNLVTLYGEPGQAPRKVPPEALVPANIKQQFHDWDAELLGASMVMVHSKVIVLDPFGDHPVVMTGSHNLGLKASQKNDDNLVILEGLEAGPLAAAYAVNIIAIYQTYRWNQYVTQHQTDTTAWHGLQDDDKWQQGHLAGDSLAELQFWMAEHLDQPATVAAAATARTGHVKAAKNTIKTARTPRG